MKAAMLVPCAAVCLLPAASRAQTARERIVIATVTDSANRPVADASVALREGLSDVIVSGTTDRAGHATLRTITRAPSAEVVARRIPFLAAYRFVKFGASDTSRVSLVLIRPSAMLDTVVVSERQTTHKARMTIDADAIAASERNLVDGLDVVTKLRPDMVLGLGGRKVCGDTGTQNVWVNGRRIRGAPDNDMIEVKRQEVLRARFHSTPAWALIAPDVLNVLSTIKPEHIQSIDTSDCNHMPLGMNGDRSGIFISLKPGVSFEPGIGSVLQDDDDQLATVRRIVMGPRSKAVLLPTEPRIPPRLLGLFDGDTGDPIVGAEVIDAASGTRASSSETGTVALDYVTPGPALIVIQRAGYRTDSLHVKISPADTIPITLLLKRVAAAH